MQQAKQATFKQYVLAGDTLTHRDRILVSSHVSLENPGEQDARDVFVAGAAKREAYQISYKVAAIALAVCLAICGVMVGSRMNLTRRLEGEYAQLSARYQAAQSEHQRLLETFNQKSDASGICYYAVQALGMRLAGQEETVGVQASGLPYGTQADTLRGSASNNR